MIKNKLLQLLGLLNMGIGGLSISGYISGTPQLYLWAGEDGMALNSAILFFMQGIVFYIVGQKNK